MNAPTHRIRAEFDRLALLTEKHGGDKAGDTYHDYLRRQLPPGVENALEVGCGAGEFTRLLASRARNVVALDLSPEMIRQARAHPANPPSIEYRSTDVMEVALPAAGFDCIVSIATLHHLPLEQARSKMKDALAPGGVLVIHDLVADDGVLDRCRSVLASAVSAARRFRQTNRIRMPREIREAWAEHGEGEVYLTMPEVEEMRRRYLPGASVKRHLLWRYTVVWRKRGTA